MRLKTKYLILLAQLLLLFLPLLKKKIGEIENKINTDHDHNKYITAQEFNN